MKEILLHPFYFEEQTSALVSPLLKVMHPYELHHINLPLTVRRELLEHLLQFYALHLQDFGTMKTLPVLQEVLGLKEPNNKL